MVQDIIKAKEIAHMREDYVLCPGEYVSLVGVNSPSVQRDIHHPESNEGSSHY